jgi:hypothetical protein
MRDFWDLTNFVILFLKGSLASSPDPDVVREALNFLLSPEVKNKRYNIS